MSRSTMLNVTVGAVAVGLVTAGLAWTLLDTDDTRAVAPVSVTSVSDATPDPSLPTDDASGQPSGQPSDDATGDDGAGATPEPSTPAGGGAVAVPEGVTLERAKEIALAAKAGTVREIELEEEHGRTAWKVELRTAAGGEWEVYVDAVTGDVIRSERD